MKLPSFLRRSSAAAPPAAEAWRAGAIRSEEAVAQARRRARRRLIGAIVLVAIGVIAFPLVFETAPRPIPVDVAIDIPKRDGLPPLVVPAAPSVAAAASGVDPSTGAAAPATPAASAVAVRPAAAAATPPAAAPPAVRAEAARPTPPPASPTDAGRARALLEGQPVAKAAPAAPVATAAAPAAAAPKFVLQIGAFAEAAAVKDARDRAEKAGLKTFTQPVTTDAGVRTRVRVGPFASREEALAAQARAEAAGLKSVVMPQ